MYKEFCILSHSAGGSVFGIAGRGYASKKEAEKYIKLFKVRNEALNKVNYDFGIDSEIRKDDMQYTVGTIEFDENKFE